MGGGGADFDALYQEIPISKKRTIVKKDFLMFWLIKIPFRRAWLNQFTAAQLRQAVRQTHAYKYQSISSYTKKELIHYIVWNWRGVNWHELKQYLLHGEISG